MKAKRCAEALEILQALGLPRAQQNERSALCLLAILDMMPQKKWAEAARPLMGITPILDWVRKHYDKDYAPNTRETVRRQTMHQFVAAGLVTYNPDDPKRAVNSPHAVYQIAGEALELIRSFGAPAWATNLKAYLLTHSTLAGRYAVPRTMNQIAVKLVDGKELKLSPGEHSKLIRDIIEDFAPRWAPGSKLVYAGDTGQKWGYFDAQALAALGVAVDTHGKMPDVVLLDTKRNWLVVVESVTSHGPVDGKRHAELMTLFETANVPLVYVTAFPTRQVMARFLAEIAWETEAWVADAPHHLIHFNGDRFLGPHS